MNSLGDLSYNLLSLVVGVDEESTTSRKRLLRFADPKLFRDEAYILYKVLHAFKDKSFAVDEEFLSLYLMNNRKLVSSSKSFIDISSYGDIDGDEVLGYIAGVLDYHKRLKSNKSSEDFDLVVEKYLLEFKRVELERALIDSKTILEDSLKVKGKELSGFEDSVNYYRQKTAEISGLVDVNMGQGFRTAEDVYEEGKEAQRFEKVSDFHMIDELNNQYGGIYAGMMYIVLAPPKAGKSKFCTRMAHQAVVKYGQNVTVWAVEGGSDAWLAQLRAVHFDYMFNTGVDITQRRYGVSQGTILKGLLDPELAALEDSSRSDLLYNPSYGRVNFIDIPMNVENFLDHIDTAVKANGSSVLVIDYLQLIQSHRQMTERERISDAYPRLLNYVRMNKIAALLPAQYSQESVKDTLRANDLSKIDTRVMGGGSSEMVRTTDYLIPLWATTEDIANHKVSLLPATARMDAVSGVTELYVDAESCLFCSINES